MRQILLFLGTTGFLIALAACGRPDTLSQAAAATSISVPTQVKSATSSVAVAGHESYVIDRSLKESVNNAKVIITGTVIDTGATFNSRRDTQDTTMPAVDSFGVGQEYTIQVQRYLKSTGPTLLTVIQSEGAILTSPELVTQADIDRAKAASGTTPLEKGTQYLLLLKSVAAYYPGTDYYAAQGMPWRFVLTPSGDAKVDVPREIENNVPTQFIPDPQAPLIPQVEQFVVTDSESIGK